MIGEIKHIVIIESLDVAEKHTGAELYSDIVKRHIELVQPEPKMTHRFFDIQTKEEFIDCIKFLIVNSDFVQGGLLIHLEMHGSSKLDGLVLGNRSLVTWIELVDIFRELNVKLCDKLFITMATCHGRYLYKGGNANLKSPFSGYISATSAVTVREILRDFTIIFESLIKSRNIVESYLELDALGSNFFYKDSKGVFEDSFESTLKQIRADPTIKEGILKIAIEESEKVGEPIADDEIKELIFEKALRDIYQKHKAAYEFDC